MMVAGISGDHHVQSIVVRCSRGIDLVGTIHRECIVLSVVIDPVRRSLDDHVIAPCVVLVGQGKIASIDGCRNS